MPAPLNNERLQNPGWKALVGVLRFLTGLALLLFLPARTLHYWQGWVLLTVFSICLLAITYYLIKHDPELLRRRLRAGPAAEKEKRQKLIIGIAITAFVVLIVLPSMSHPMQKPSMPVPLILMGDALVALGFWVIGFVFRANSYASGVIEAEDEQQVISTGPYALVRHPMYSGGLIMLLGIPFALASWWDLIPLLFIVFIVAWRLLDEERFLRQHLAGYTDYCENVRYRLLPGVW